MNRRALGSRYFGYAVLHVLAGAAGGIAAVGLVRLIASELGLEIGGLGAAVLAAAIIGAGILADLEVLPLPIPSGGAQVPAMWRTTTHPLFWVPAFGFLLGATFFTRITSAAVLFALVGAGLVIADPALAAVFGLAYGAARTSIVFTRAAAEHQFLMTRRVLRVSVAAATVVVVLVPWAGVGG